jgi:DNA-binding MarR family transcriptional regulator
MDNLTETITYLSDLTEKVLEEAIVQSDFDDLTQQQFQYFKVIVKMKNPTLTELARELSLTKPTVTVLVNRLTEKGYIKRVHSDEDRRVMHLHIDKKGTKLGALRKIAHERMSEIIRAGLSETETGILTELLKKIMKQSAVCR